MGRPFAAILKLSNDHKLEFDFGQSDRDDEALAEVVDFSGRSALGPCPKCGSTVYEHGMSYVCEHSVGVARSCDFRSGKIILQQEIGESQMRKLLAEGQAGDNLGALLRGTKKEEVERGQVLCKPGSITPHTNFEASVYVLTKEEGGRHKPFFSNYRPQFYFRTTDVTGTIELPAGTEMVMPGDNTEMVVNLGKPIAMEEGLTFSIREGGRTVGSGRVTKILK